MGDSTYSYGYDLAGNLVNNNGTTRTFNAANQMTNDGTNTLTYDNNGNLTSDGTNTHTWDRANRLLSVGTHSYAYDGNGARIQKTVSSVVTDYLLDVQPGLTQVLRESDGTNTNHYIHSPRGIHAMNDGSNWSYMLQDGLGSVRAEIGANVAVNGNQSYTPYGEVFGASGSFAPSYGFTGEQTDANGQVYLRARYYNPSIGVFNALDPFEGSVGRPMSLNGYSWVEGNPVMWTDPSGMETLRDCLGDFEVQSDSLTDTIQQAIAGSSAVLASLLNNGICLSNQEIPSGPDDYDIHIGLGLANFAEGGEGAERLRTFIYNLNKKYQRLTRYPTAVMDRMWDTPKCFRGGNTLTKGGRGRFQEKFFEGVNNPRVVKIHFNIEGLKELWEAIEEEPDHPVTNLLEFAMLHGNFGDEYIGAGNYVMIGGRRYLFIVTAWELANVSKDKRLCNIASFYEQGTSTIENPNPKLKDEICKWDLERKPRPTTSLLSSEINNSSRSQFLHQVA